MFTGIVQSLGQIRDIDKTGDDLRITVDIENTELSWPSIGDSVSVNGVCVTVVGISDNGMIFDISRETLSCTKFGMLKISDKVNVELAMQLSDRLDGHIVTGHVDTVVKLLSITDDGRSQKFIFELPDEYTKYICSKGSICIDGVSLTVNAVDRNTFSVNIIPHTLQHTIFSEYISGTTVNLEVDIISRYLEQLIHNQ